MVKKIVIFAGHDHDTWERLGAKGVKTDLEKDGVFEEFDSNFILAKGAVKILRTVPGLKVYFPQEDGRRMTLKQRVDYANAIGADFMIDIHSNASASRTATGAAAFYWISSKNGKRAADIYAKHLKEAGLPLWSNGTFASNDKDGWSGFYMLKQSDMPAILLENFFFTTRSDLEKFLLNPAVQLVLIEIIAKTAVEYLGLRFPAAKPIEVIKPIPVVKPAADSNRDYLIRDDRGSKVEDLQKNLNRLGENLTIDGIFGKATEDAVKRFQKKDGLEVDGIFGKASAAKLTAILAGISKPSVKPAATPKPTEKEVGEMPKEMIVIFSENDYLAARKLSIRQNIPVIERAGVKGKIAEKVYIVGGGKSGLEKAADSFIDLSGDSWEATVAKVDKYLND